MACFTSNSKLVLTGCNNGLIKSWSFEEFISETEIGINEKPLATVDEAHDLGITCGECTPEKSKLFHLHFHIICIPCFVQVSPQPILSIAG